MDPSKLTNLGHWIVDIYAWAATLTVLYCVGLHVRYLLDPRRPKKPRSNAAANTSR